MPQNLSFVKFQRGSANAYANLKRNNRLESDALYFIYDSTAPEEGGLLYLGDVLIGGTGSAAGASALSELSDVNLSGVTLLDGMILQYNNTAHKWEPIAASELLPIVAAGTKTGLQTDADVLNRIDSAPLEGDIVFVDSVPYIYNGSSWQLLVGQNLEDRITDLESQLQAVDGKIATAISNANHLTYTRVDELPAIENAAANTVYLVGDPTTTGENKYEEYLVVNGAFEKIGNFGTDLNDYVTLTTFNTTVGNLQNSISNLQNNLNNYVLVETYASEVGEITDLRTALGDNSATVIDTLLDVHDRLIWNDLDNN